MHFSLCIFGPVICSDRGPARAGGRACIGKASTIVIMFRIIEGSSNSFMLVAKPGLVSWMSVCLLQSFLSAVFEQCSISTLPGGGGLAFRCSRQSGLKLVLVKVLLVGLDLGSLYLFVGASSQAQPHSRRSCLHQTPFWAWY